MWQFFWDTPQRFRFNCDNLLNSKVFQGILDQWTQFKYLVAEVSVDQDGWGNHGPEVDGCGQPGGDNLHPHRRRVVVEGGDVSGHGGAVPVGEGHHDIECGQGKHHMEKGPAVSHLWNDTQINRRTFDTYRSKLDKMANGLKGTSSSSLSLTAPASTSPPAPVSSFKSTLSPPVSLAP